MAGIINMEILDGNELWRFVAILVIIILALAAGKIVQFVIGAAARRREQARGKNVVSLFLDSIAKPAMVVTFAIGFSICETFLVFAKEGQPESIGIDPAIGEYWTKISAAVFAIAVTYAIYRMVDIIEFYLLNWTSKSKTKLDDMLVPIIRKSVRVTILIMAFLWIADGILEWKIRTILLSAGVGGIAIALAAKETIENFLGSITIFADRPFQIDELVRVNDHLGPVEDVGFRSTRIRTLQGHLVTVPNSIIANSIVENLGKRPFIRRTSNITITYNSGHTKAARAVGIIKEILSAVPEINTDTEKPPRVYFNEFNDCSLNIYMSYWVKPPDYWVYQDVNQRINLEMMKRFEAEKIEFAFPTQTLYLKKE
ncbi:MAG: mechanosensitive ion channel family protein [Phycisphaerae bacterium]|nr:mechanosensitive ion channel family protein [Phycisphaerae bacterium]